MTRFICVCLCGLSLLTASVSGAQTAPTKEYQIKAAFLLNFAHFVEWPSHAFTNAESPITIGILGDNPFGAALAETVRDETVQKRRLNVQHGKTLDELKGCQLIFISKSERARTAEILSSLTNSAVLTVSEVEGFARRGGVVNFYLEGTKVRFEINPSAARDGGLKLSSELLNLGRIVGSSRREER